MTDFSLQSEFDPKGDQPKAIDQLAAGVVNGLSHQVLLGVTGSGKTFTLAQVIARISRPTLILAPNKTLAAQLYNEFRTLFPQNAVEYFVSYYDYYQPEAYLPSSDTYIAKDSSINDMIDKLRHSATRSVLSRRDVIVVASVSCIFGLGAPEDYLAMRYEISTGMSLERDHLLRELISRHYSRNDVDFYRGTFRVRGDRVEIFPAYEEDLAIRIDFFGDEIEGISEIDPLRGVVHRRLDRVVLYPASHYVTRKKTLKRARETIMAELKQQLERLNSEQRLVEVQRLEERTQFDLEMMQELGYCTGIENYSRHLTGRSPGEPPPTLLDYFPDDFLVCIDESHIGVPQVRAMFKGDRSRKKTLVEYGFRLPSALDNRPLRFDEFTQRVPQTIFVSATPADYEMDMSGDAVAEQIVRPTGLLDPQLVVRPAQGQVDDLYAEIRLRMERNERVLVTTLTKRMAEDLTDYFGDMGIRIRYLHADVHTLERMAIIHDLRLGEFDVLVGINLLREGLDLPEVSLVAILDADKEGFLRSTRSLIQTFGRAARNVNGMVLLYADRITKAMRSAMDETDRRRRIQQAYNETHGIVPKTVNKAVGHAFNWPGKQVEQNEDALTVAEASQTYISADALDDDIQSLEAQMSEAVRELAFETAAELRDRIRELRRLRLAG